MEKTKVVIVDDSAFSVAVIRDVLEENGFEVVGSACMLHEVKKVVSDTMPDLVTMDMTLPGTDGLECTRAIREIDENIKVIVISSMMDEEIVREAKKLKISGYVQKPLDADELLTAISRVMEADQMFSLLQAEGFAVFKESLLDATNKMTKALLTYGDDMPGSREYNSEGVTVIIGISGRFSGRLLLGMSIVTAKSFTVAALRREPKDTAEITATLAEFANIVAGNACSHLNKKNKALGLRLAPPSVLLGENIKISPPNFQTYTTTASAPFGPLLLNGGFKRGEDSWT